jgi:hypothetical protein
VARRARARHDRRHADQKRLYEKLIWAGRQVIENNQDRLNVKGVGWKNFLPAKWEREMGGVFTAKTGIVIKQPGRAYRNPVNVPDDAERAALIHYVKAGHGENAPIGRPRSGASRRCTATWSRSA